MTQRLTWMTLPYTHSRLVIILPSREVLRPKHVGLPHYGHVSADDAPQPSSGWSGEVLGKDEVLVQFYWLHTGYGCRSSHSMVCVCTCRRPVGPCGEAGQPTAAVQPSQHGSRMNSDIMASDV